MQPLHVLILAAGDGKRMSSRTPKLLHACAGLPLVEHAVRAAIALDGASVWVVVGPDAEGIRSALAGLPVQFAVQQRPLGTGDAVAAGIESIGAAATGRLLVLNGDCPGVQTRTLEKLVATAGDAAAAVLAVLPEDRRGYGRLVLSDDQKLVGIVEEADCAGVDEGPINGGAYVFDLDTLRNTLAHVGDDNAQSERYLTSVFGLLSAAGTSMVAVHHEDADEVHGVNSRAELARAEALLRRRTLDRLMEDGVTFRDPATAYVDVDVIVGADTVIFPGVTLEGRTTLGVGCVVRSHVRISNSDCGAGVTILDGTIIEDSAVSDGAVLGPYARLRPGSDIGSGAKVGNFVETKATRLGNRSKAGHLSYLGNARIGDDVNIGAGTITCNYDGTHKHETVIADGAFIGSNTALVAPVRVGEDAYVGAGSTITEDVPDGALGIARGRQVNKKAWADDKDSD